MCAGRLSGPPLYSPSSLLSPEPSWSYLRLALLQFNLSLGPQDNQTASSGCQVPKLDPWEPAIMSWASRVVGARASPQGK